MNKRLFLKFLLVAILGSVAPKAVAADDVQVVTTFVAASTEDSVKEIAALFTQETNIKVRINSGASNALATQIINGAEADTFLSASMEWADELEKKGLAADVHPLLTNRLVIVVPKGNPAGVKTPSDLQSEKVRHVALAGEKVPAGSYAAQALQKGDVYDRLLKAKKIVRGQDVRGTLAFVDRGEVEAGVVYATDALVSRNVEVVYAFEKSAHDKIVYPLVLLKHGTTSPAAKQWFVFLSSEAAGKVFAQHGFELLK